MKTPNRILVVDDKEYNRELMEAILSPQGYEVFLAADGVEALDTVAQILPDLVMLDVMMPVMDGFQVARQLKAHEETRGIPIVMVTALKDVTDRVNALEAGADDFLSKPVERIEVLARVRSLLKVKQYNDQTRRYQKELEEQVQLKTEQLRATLRNLQQATLETIYRLSRAAEYKDEDTHAHLFRMSHYAAAVARRLGHSSEQTRALLYAAPMHDVGKIGIPERILLKPGKLDAQEWDTMKKHTTIGVKILEGSQNDLMQLAEVIAHSHHEKWDGSGYPRGLAGEDIPIVGRISAIADVFDALTSKRPYKEPFSIEKSFSIIREGHGNHFDPLVVDAFFDISDEILEIKARFSDEHIEGIEDFVAALGKWG